LSPCCSSCQAAMPPVRLTTFWKAKTLLSLTVACADRCPDAHTTAMLLLWYGSSCPALTASDNMSKGMLTAVGMVGPAGMQAWWNQASWQSEITCSASNSSVWNEVLLCTFY
jgi:hypothetical protein